MKNSSKGFIISVIIVIVALSLIGGGIYFYTSNTVEAPANTPDIIGDNRDVYGCIGSAGYTWCAVKNKCLRIWEEKCELTPINSGPGDKNGLIACTMDARQCPDGSYVGRSGPKCEFVCPVLQKGSY